MYIMYNTALANVLLGSIYFYEFPSLLTRSRERFYFAIFSVKIGALVVKLAC